MKLAVVSDTHLPRFGSRLPPALRRGILDEGVELIVHLGDFTAPFVPALLEELAPLAAVAGNNDPPEIVRRYGRRRVLEIAGVRVGMVHGDEGRGARTVDRAVNAFGGADAAAGELDAVLFGHSHVPLLERRGRLLLLNPGSPTDRRRQPAFSYAILTVESGVLAARSVTYPDRRAP